MAILTPSVQPILNMLCVFSVSSSIAGYSWIQWIQLDTAGYGLFGCFGVSILPYSGQYLEGMEPILQIKT